MIKPAEHEYLMITLKDFLIDLKSLLASNVVIYNSHSGEKETVLEACPKTLTYTLSVSGKKDLSHKLWDEIDYMRFRNSFKFKDGFTV